MHKTSDAESAQPGSPGEDDADAGPNGSLAAALADDRYSGDESPPSRDDTILAPQQPVLKSRVREVGINLWTGVRRWPNVLLIIILVPFYVMVGAVRSGSHMQWFDYWFALPRFVNPDGSLSPHGLFAFTNEHIAALPGVIYWLNVRLTGGSNIALGLFDILLVAAEVILLTLLLPPASVLGGWHRSVLIVAFGVLLLAPEGAWNFMRAGSGTAWFMANLFVLGALVLANRRHYLLTIPLAVLAELCYGTGLMAWPVIVLVAVLAAVLGERWTWRQTTVAISAFGGAIVYLAVFKGSESQAHLAPDDILSRACQVLGSIFTSDPDFATLLGAVALVCAGFLAVVAVRARRQVAVPWIGVSAYATLSAILIGLARENTGDTGGLAGRYASLAALMWISLIVLSMIMYSERLFASLGVVVIAVAVFVSGQPAFTAMNLSALQQEELAIAVRMGVDQGYIYYNPPVDPLLKELKHFPFSSDFTADCGLLGQRLDPSQVEDGGTVLSAQTPVVGALEQLQPPINTGSLRPSGWVASRGSAIRCIVFADPSLRVVGAASYGYERDDVDVGQIKTRNKDLGFVGVAYAKSGPYTAYAILDNSNVAYRLHSSLSA
jgi:hypothetical protein